jgi:hypothetical protein
MEQRHFPAGTDASGVAGPQPGLSAVERARILDWVMSKGPGWDAELIAGPDGYSLGLITPRSPDGPTGPLLEWLILRDADGIAVLNNLGSFRGRFRTAGEAIGVVEAAERPFAPSFPLPVQTDRGRFRDPGNALRSRSSP